MPKSLFWLDQLADRAEKEKRLRKGQLVTIACGWSVSGPIHIGNFRADGIIPNVLASILKERGYKTRKLLVIYTQDRFKAAPGQLLWFDKPAEAAKHLGVPPDYRPSQSLIEKYAGVRLIDVPDPAGCCSNWVEHFSKPAIAAFKDFGINFEILTTTDFYKLDETKKLIKEILKRREKIIEIINQYRKTKPYPADWQPINPWCSLCKNIADNKVLELDLKKWQVKLRCSRCGKESTSSLESAKLDWKLEWAALWYVFNTSIEPYGKDHAVPGGSKDVGEQLIRLLGKQPPFGFFTEWIGKAVEGEDLGDMTSSGNIGFTPAQFLQIAQPELLRYFYLEHDPTRRFAFDFQSLPRYYDDYDRAERIYFGKEAASAKEKADIKRSFALAQIKELPKPLYKLPFSFASLLAQTVPKKEDVFSLLKKLGHVKSLTQEEKKSITSRLNYAKKWLLLWASERYKVKIQQTIKPDIKKRLTADEKAALAQFGKELGKKITEKQLEKKIREICTKTKTNPKAFFRAAYLVLLGKESGPRLSTLALLQKDAVLNLLKKL